VYAFAGHDADKLRGEMNQFVKTLFPGDKGRIFLARMNQLATKLNVHECPTLVSGSHDHHAVEDVGNHGNHADRIVNTL
jgi:hypothetical protein